MMVWVLRRLGVQEAGGIFTEKTQRHLHEAEAVEVFSLGGANAGDGPFHNAPILGSAVITSKRMRKRLLNRILLANRYNIGGFLCLGAEYGVRVRSSGTIIDLTFCFDCHKVWVKGTEKYDDCGSTVGFPITLLNTILKKAGVPLPPRQPH
ncbi:MAG: hypothetical protein K8U57_14560 [Planctomycetes bacterium]|nr:hypothetical protein [Planctomycetota bacterium]